MPAVAQLVAKLIEIGVTEWRRREDARRLLVGILSSLRTELTQNWSAIAAALRKSTDVSLSMESWRDAGAAVGSALADVPLVLGALEQAYTHAGMAIEGSDRAGLLAAQSDLGRAIRTLNDFIERERLVKWKPSAFECQPPRNIEELLAGMQFGVITEIAEIWKRFQTSIAANEVRRYNFEEVSTVRAERNPLRDAQVRADARRRFGDRHCFELAKGIFEFWIEADTRILFTEIDRRTRPLVLVRLSEPEEDDWSPEKYLRLAECRRDQLSKPLAYIVHGILPTIWT